MQQICAAEFSQAVRCVRAATVRHIATETFRNTDAKDKSSQTFINNTKSRNKEDKLGIERGHKFEAVPDF